MDTSLEAPLDEQEPSRLMNALAVPVRLVGALVAPDRVVPEAVRAGRAAAAIILVTLASLVASVVIGLRLDMTSVVVAKYPDRPGEKKIVVGDKKPDDEPKSDHELDEQIKKERSMAQVTMGLGAGLGTPVIIVGFGLLLLALGKFVGGKPTFSRSLAAAAYASLPAVVKAAIMTVAALGYPSLHPMQAAQLVPRLPGPHVGGLLERLLTIDPFSIWSLIILGFALAAAAEISRRKAFVSATVLVVLLQLLMGGTPT